MPYNNPDTGLIEIHRMFGAGFYVPILCVGWKITYPSNVIYSTRKEDYRGNPSIVWEYDTPYGTISRRRIWEEKSYSWPILEWGVKNEQHLKILQYALARREFLPEFESYRKWNECVGDTGVVYMPFGYSAMGVLLNSWMGVEQTIYAVNDMESSMMEFIETVNENNLKLVDLLCESPAEVILMGDNFSSDIQSPAFFCKVVKEVFIVKR